MTCSDAGPPSGLLGFVANGKCMGISISACRLNLWQFAMSVFMSCCYPLNKLIKVTDHKNKTKTDSRAAS